MINQYALGMEIIAPSYINGMPEDVYHGHQGSISNSGLRLVGRSPAHYKYAPQREQTRNMVIGSALHMAILEPDRCETIYKFTDATDRRCKEYKEIAAIHGGDFTLTRDESWHIAGIRDSLWSNFRELLSLPGYNELSGFSTDPETGVMCRHRFDKLTEFGIAIDLKTTIDARPDAFSRSIYNYGYHMQHAFYADQYEWITGRKLDDFIFLVVESDAPYATKAYRLNQESIDVGSDMYRKALNEYAKCSETGVYPAYESNEIDEISIPDWAMYQHDKKQIDNFVFVEE